MGPVSKAVNAAAVERPSDTTVPSKRDLAFAAGFDKSGQLLDGSTRMLWWPTARTAMSKSRYIGSLGSGKRTSKTLPRPGSLLLSLIVPP